MNNNAQAITQSEPPLAKPKGERLMSLDTLRGFSMFFVISGVSIFHSLPDIINTPFTRMIATQMVHTVWNGLTFRDLLFPAFIFIAGVTFPFSSAKRLENGTKNELYKRILTRAVKLIFFGLLYNGLLHMDFAHLRICSVQGRIGLAWAIAALIYITTKRTSTRILWCAGMFIAYWVLTICIPAPDFPHAGVFTAEGNLSCYIDRLLIPAGNLPYGLYDPEGILSTMPAVATSLVGMLAGQFIRSEYKGFSQIKKVLYLIGIGIAFILAGNLWGMVYPVNKRIWSSSFGLLVSGCTMLALAVFYLIIDIWKFRKWTLFFRVIGMNSLAIYMGRQFIDFSFTANEVFGGVIGFFPESYAKFLLNIAFLIVTWSLLFWLYKKKIIIKI